MKLQTLTMLLLLLAFSTKATDSQDSQALGYHFEICNTCSSSASFKNVALKSNPGNGTIPTVVVNMKTGQIKSYRVWVDFEPGYGYEGGWVRDAYITSTPYSATSAVSNVEAMFNQMEIVANKPISRDSPILPIYIDSVTSGIPTPNAATILSGELAGDAVSNFIRLKTLVGLQDYASAAFKLLVLKLNITVTTISPDGSKIDWILLDLTESKRPYRIIRGSARDKNNQKINDSYFPVPSGVNYREHETYDNYNNDGPGIQLTCITYTVEYSFGQVGYSVMCFKSY